MADEPRDYEVGYGRPPTHTQFRPGTSGNPKGRPKGKKNLQTIVLAVLSETITVTENGRTLQMTKAEAAVRQQVNKALMGEPRAIRDTLRLLDAFEQRPEDLSDEIAAPENDRAVMKSLLRRMQGAASSLTTEGSRTTEEQKS